jgi:DNA modification methylase
MNWENIKIALLWILLVLWGIIWVAGLVKWAGIFGTEKEPDKDKSRKHPTQKPVDLSVWFIKNFSGEEHLIADLFLGSGSTLIACEKTNRICYGMELDPKYVDVIIKRWEDYTQQKAVKL